MTTISISASINKDIRTVWNYYTQPDHITGWNFASDDWCCPCVENNLSVGGKYNARMEAKDGSFGFDFETTYDEVIPHQLIRYTMADGRKATILFSENENVTTITIDFEAENMNSEDLQRQGWQAILNNFKTYTETH
ncbi:MAG: SRPBCC family protein [Bacteroidetes bacterium]|jgi:uncharacterized protein YndB with AHSA1/START domain|nr:SRPBCC family protein [Bacteroidota bacterium]